MLTVLFSACGGGGGVGIAPSAPKTNPFKNNFGSSAPGTLTVSFLPSNLQSTAHHRRPNYISNQGGAFVMIVYPQDPAERADFPNGAIGCTNASAPITAPITVSVAAPPGPDYFTIAEYSGGCSGTAPPGATGALLTAFEYLGDQTTPANNVPAVLPTTGLTYNSPIQVIPGIANDLNELTWVAYNNFASAPAPPPAPPAYPFAGPNAAQLSPNFGAPTGVGPPAGTLYPTFLLNAILAQVRVAATISNPVMETGVFQKLVAPTNQIVDPLTVQTLDSAGASLSSPTGVPVPTGAVVPIPFNTNVTLTLAETDPVSVPAGNLPAPHTKLWLIDTTTSKVVASGTSVQFSQNGALDANTIAIGNGACGGACAPGDAMAFYVTYDGATQVAFNFFVVTPTFTPAALPAITGAPAITPVNVGTGAIAAQSSVVSTNNLIPAPATAYTSPVGLANIAASGLYVADGAQVKLDNTATVSAAVGGAAYSAITFDANNNFVYVVDNANPGGAATIGAQPSAVFGYNSAGLAGGQVPLQNQSGFFGIFAHPQGIVYDANTAIYVAAQNQIWEVDLTGTNAGSYKSIAGNSLGTAGFTDAPTPGTSSTALFNFGAGNFIGMVTDITGATSQRIYIADAANNAVRVFDPQLKTVTTVATLAGVTGLGLAGTAFSSGVIATAPGGLYSLPSIASAAASGGTVAPQLILAAQGSACAGSTDGFVGIPGGISNPYTLQYNAGWTGGTVPAPAVQALLGATVADSMAGAQSGGLFANTGTVCKPLGVTYVSGNAGAFPGGTYIFTEAGKLRGYL